MTFIKRLTYAPYQAFKTSAFYQKLKAVKSLRSAKLAFDQLASALLPRRRHLHGDSILENTFILLGCQFRVTSICETGTFMGVSTSFMAREFPSTPIYTSEINPNSFTKAKKSLEKHKNVTCFEGTSPKFLTHLFDRDLLGNCPMFYLDAHWRDAWPLEDEIKIISTRTKRAVIMIDDFKVPDGPQFNYDSYADKECSLDMILPQLNKKQRYQALFPNYQANDVFPDDVNRPEITGYVIIFQNLPNEFIQFSNDPFIKKYFSDRSDLLTASSNQMREQVK